MMKVLKNYPFDHIDLPKQVLIIKENDTQWDQAYSNWLQGKNPSADPGWKEGAYLGHCEDATTYVIE
jgi:hypothetical protein